MTQEFFSGKVSNISIVVYQHLLTKFQSKPDNFTDFKSYLIFQRCTLCKKLYNERMTEMYTHAHTTNKKHIYSTLCGGSAKRLILMSDYISMPTAVNTTDNDVLVTEPKLVKLATREYWSKLYSQQETPDVPKLWLLTLLVIAIHKQVEDEPFQWPVPVNVVDFRAMLRCGNHKPAPGPDEWEKWCVKSLLDFALSLVLRA
jgi:hypothetical protein